jgi:hypothetical protein
MEPSSDFRWPSDPDESWWLLEGTEAGLRLEYIKFAAAKFGLGGHDSRKNTLAAELAGIQATPSQAFRIARSVSVQKLLDKAKKIQAGKVPPLTDREIAQRIDLMVRSPDHRSAAVGIELLAKRQLAARSRDDLPSDPAELLHELLATMGIEGVLSAAELWFTTTQDLLTCPNFELLAPTICRRFPDCWRRYRAPLLTRAEFFKSPREQGFLDRFDAAGLAPEPSAEAFRAAVGKAAKGTLPRGNGAAAPAQAEQVGDIENAAA